MGTRVIAVVGRASTMCLALAATAVGAGERAVAGAEGADRLTAQQGRRFSADYVDVEPVASALRWQVPLGTADRDSLSSVGVVSGFGAYRASYVRGHLHTGADLVVRGERAVPGQGAPGPAEVVAAAAGAVCSVHLGAPHATVVVKHRLKDGSLLFTAYKHLAEIYVVRGQQVTAETRLGRLYSQAEAHRHGGNYDHLHFEVRLRFDDYGAASWTTMERSVLRARFLDPVPFLRRALSENASISSM